MVSGRGPAHQADASRRPWGAAVILLALSGAWGCSGPEVSPRSRAAPGARAPGCVEASPVHRLPAAVRESSGLAWSLRFPGVLWTHDDSGGSAELVAIGPDGMLRSTIRVEGAHNRDWEDLAASPCGDGTCLWIADTGDNLHRRDDLALIRVPEPEVLASGSVPAIRLPIRLPDGPRDIEALFVLPGERPYLITKGGRHPVTVYRYPLPLRAGERVLLEEVQVLFTGRRALRDRITGASAAPDGSEVLVRSYRELHRFTVEGGRLVATPGSAVNLASLEERQGEAVAWGADDLVALTSEAGLLGRSATLRIIRCAWP